MLPDQQWHRRLRDHHLLWHVIMELPSAPASHHTGTVVPALEESFSVHREVTDLTFATSRNLCFDIKLRLPEI